MHNNRGPAVRTDIEDKLRAYFSKRKEVVAAFLFGSYARNQERFDSDVDVAVLLTPEAAPEASALRSLYGVHLGKALGRDVQTVMMNTAGEELLKQIFSKGKRLQVNDSRNYAIFQMSAYCRIADFARYRKMFQRGFINRLRKEVRLG